MELDRLITLLRRWTWLLILGLVVGVFAGFMLSKIPTPIYQANTKILISRAPQNDSTELTFIDSAELIDTYIELQKAKPILDEVSKQLNYEIDPKQIQIEQIQKAQLIEIKVENPDAQLSVEIANRLVDVLIQQNENLQAGWYGSREESLKLQIEEVETQIRDLQSQFDLIQEQDIQVQLERVNEQIATNQGEILTLQNDIDVLEVNIKSAEVQKDIEWLSLPNTRDQQALIAEQKANLAHLESSLRLYQQLETETIYQKETVGEQIASLEDEISSLQKDISELTLEYEAMNLQNEMKWLLNAAIGDQRSQLADKKAQLSQLESVLTMYQQVRVNLIILGKPYQLDNNREDPRIQRLQATLDLYDQIYLNLTNNLEAIQLASFQSLPNITQIEAATLPEDPIRPIPWLSGVLSGVIVFMLMAGWVGWYEGMDTSIKTHIDIKNIFGLPVIENIHKMEHGDEAEKGLYIIKQPYSPIADAFRTIQAELILSRKGNPLTTILVSSAEPGEGKTTVAINLAMTFAQSDKQIVLLDANLRNPNIRELLETRYRRGLTDMLEKGVEIEDSMRYLNKVNEVTIIPHGNRDVTGLLDTDRLTDIIKMLKTNYDLVVIDGPSMSVADTQLWASKVDGVLLVVQPEFTPIASAIHVRDQLHQADAKLLGIVFNTLAVKLTGFNLVIHRLKEIPTAVPSFFRRMISRMRLGIKQRFSAIRSSLRNWKAKSEYKDLEEAIELSGDSAEKIRYQAVLLWKMDQPFEEIQKITGCSRSDLIAWEESFEKDGIDALRVVAAGETLPS